jgi:hypothetical protein
MALVTSQSTLPDFEHEYHTVIVDSFDGTATNNNVFTVFLQTPIENIVQAQLITANIRLASAERVCHVSINELDTIFTQRASSSVNGQADKQVLNRNFGTLVKTGDYNSTHLVFKNEYPVMQQYINPIRKLDRLSITLRSGDATSSVIDTNNDSIFVFRFVCKKRNLPY